MKLKFLAVLVLGLSSLSAMAIKADSCCKSQDKCCSSSCCTPGAGCCDGGSGCCPGDCCAKK